MHFDVSVVIPTYNCANTLGVCLQSVFAQTSPPAEVIVVDDASTDESREIAQEFPVSLIELTHNSGPAAARNAGARLSRHPVVFFVDADGALDPEAIAAALSILDSEPDVGCVHGVYRDQPLVSPGLGNAAESYLLLHHTFWRTRAAGRVRSAFFAMAAIRREVFDTIGWFDENLRASEDVEFSDRMSARYAIVLTPQISGRHDERTRVWPMLTGQFRRSQLLIPVALHERGPAGLRANSPAGLLLAVLTIGSLPFGLLWPPLFLATLAFLIAFIFADLDLNRFVQKRRGTGYLMMFLGLHFLIQLAITCGALAGGLKLLLNREFGPSRLTATESPL